MGHRKWSFNSCFCIYKKSERLKYISWNNSQRKKEALNDLRPWKLHKQFWIDINWYWMKMTFFFPDIHCTLYLTFSAVLFWDYKLRTQKNALRGSHGNHSVQIIYVNIMIRVMSHHSIEPCCLAGMYFTTWVKW